MIYLIVVSHGHDDIIKNNMYQHILSPGVGCQFIVRDNINSPVLYDFCDLNHIRYIPSTHQCGFAENNNEVVRMLHAEGVENGDYFIFINPDVLISPSELEKVRDLINSERPDLFTIDLYRDKDYSVRDPSVRTFPTIADFTLSYVFKKNPSIINRDSLKIPTAIEWCAGSFIGVKAETFLALEGFDQRYYMYCEDLDFCFRAKEANYSLIYYPQLKAIHEGQCSSRKFLSRHFWWHINSIFRFVLINPIRKRIQNL